MRASKKVKGAVLLTAGAALFIGAPTVYADSTGGNGGSGGNACSTGGNTSSGNDGILGGAQVLNNANLNIPVTIAGVGALLAGGKGAADTTAGDCSGGNGGKGGSAKSAGSGSDAKGGNGGSGGSGGSKGSNTTRGNDGILNGLQVGNNLTANVPVTACGVGALLARAGGKCSTSAGNTSGGNGGHGGNASAGGSDDASGSATGGKGGNGGSAGSKGSNNSVDNNGILGGAQVLNNADLNIPVTLCGVAVLLASAGCVSDVDAGNNSGGNGGNGGGASVTGGDSEVGGMAVGGAGGDGGSGSSTGGNNSVGNDGILGGLQLLNNLDANVPVTVCGLAVLGRAGCSAIVTAGSSEGGDGGNGGSAVVGDDNSGVKGVSRHHIKVVEAAHLPHTGAAGLALLPFGAALVAGGVALRRRSSVQR